MKSFKQLLVSTTTALITTALLTLPALAQVWESLNPGGGGQIQDLVLDPLQPNNAFVLSDVEGLYHTSNGGSSWNYLSNGLAGTNTLALAYDPRRPQKIYLGTTVGLHVSSNGGQTWQLQADTTRGANPTLLTRNDDRQELAVGSVLVDPRNNRRVMAGVGDKRESSIEQATVFRSTNGGTSFQVVQFGPQSASNKSILQLAYDAKRRRVYAATAEGGLWRGNNFGAPGQWSQIAAPAGMSDRVESVAVANDGTLYAAFGRANADGSQLFASRDQGASWLPLGEPVADTFKPENTPIGDSFAFRNLVVDPRSTRNRHSVLTATGNKRTGLYQLSVFWNNAVPTATWDRVFFYETRDTGNNQAPYEIGWEGGVFGNLPRPLAYGYTPLRWGTRGLWTTGDQTLYKVDNATLGSSGVWRNNWQPIYTSGPQSTLMDATFNVASNFNRVFVNKDIETYNNIGWQSTVDMDISRYGDVIVRSGADHSVYISWDNGQSWEDVSSPRRAKSQSNAVIEQDGNVYLVAHFSDRDDFGAQKTRGELWAAKINPANPQPVQWFFMAGGKNNEPFEPPLGLGVSPNGNNSNAKVYTNIVGDPTEPGRVYISTEREGAYVIPDIGALYDARVSFFPPPNPNTPSPIASMFDFPRIDESPNSNEYEGSMVLDPNDNTTLYIADLGVLYKGVRDDSTGTNLLDRDWTWTPVLTSDELMTFDAWDRNGTTTLAAATLNNGVWETKLSSDGGVTWQTLVNINALTAARAPVFDFSEVDPIIFAVEGRNDQVFLSVQTLAPTNLGYGIFEVALNGNSAGNISDITGNLPFPKSFRTKVLTDPVTNETHLYMASWGAGSWRLLLN
ncbi:MAG: hypothetical protein AAF050_16675 [Cyanobacteria bacterium J06649_5]